MKKRKPQGLFDGLLLKTNVTDVDKIIFVLTQYHALLLPFETTTVNVHTGTGVFNMSGEIKKIVKWKCMKPPKWFTLYDRFQHVTVPEGIKWCITETHIRIETLDGSIIYRFAIEFLPHIINQLKKCNP